MAPRQISAATLQNWLSSEDPPAVVDVRDDDWVGGHVRDSIHSPSGSFRGNVSSLKSELSDKSRVVFYCQFSQQRGPTCASIYARSLQGSEQEVYVLNGGFNGWAHAYGNNDKFTEAFADDLYQ